MIYRPDKRHREQVAVMMVRLFAEEAQRLRREGYRECELVSETRLLPSGGWSKRPLLPPTRSTRVLLMTLGEQWEEAPAGPFLVAGVTLKGLVRVDEAPEPLFETERDEERLDDVIDRINTRFGCSAIHPGSADTKSAPMRISFSSIPDLAAPDNHG